MIPVLDDGQVIGIITRSDLLRAFIQFGQIPSQDILKV